MLCPQKPQLLGFVLLPLHYLSKDYQPAALLLLPFHLDMRRPSPIANPFWVPDPTTNLAPPTDHSITDAAYCTAMYAVISLETTTFTEIADRYGLPHTSIQPPYKDIPWNLYASNFIRTLRRLRLYSRFLDGQSHTKLHLLGTEPPSPCILHYIAEWIDRDTPPPPPQTTLPQN